MLNVAFHTTILRANTKDILPMTEKDKFVTDREKWEQIYRDWENSDLSARNYCIKNKIEIHKFYK